MTPARGSRRYAVPFPLMSPKTRSRDAARLALALALGLGALLLAAPASAVPPGEPDPGFSDDGFALVDLAKSNEAGSAIGAMPDGRVVLGGDWIQSTPLEYGASLARLMPDGSPDPSFGFGGTRIYPLPECSPEQTYIGRLFVLPDGRILTGGECGDEFLLMRFNSDGSPDPSFDADGVVKTGFPVPIGFSAMAVEPADGSITLGGICCTGDAPEFQNSVLARYDPNGVLDPAFDGPVGNPGGGNGKVILAVDATGDDRPEDLTTLSGGRAAFTDKLNEHTFVAVVGPDGKPDPSFSGDGVAEVDHPGGIDEGGALAADPAGRIVVASAVGGLDEDIRIARFDPAGKLDAEFGLRVADPTPGEHDVPLDVEIQPDGRIVVVGSGFLTVPEMFSTAGRIGIARLLDGGEPDPSFGPDGVRSFAGPQGRVRPLDAAIDRLDGLLVAGASNPPFGPENPPEDQLAARILLEEKLFPPAALAPGNGFRFVKLRRNKRKGTAVLVVRVPGPGTVRLAKNTKLRGARVGARKAGNVKLQIRLRGKFKRRLAGRARKGRKKVARLRVKARVTYRPAGGSPRTKVKRFKLVRKGGRGKRSR